MSGTLQAGPLQRLRALVDTGGNARLHRAGVASTLAMTLVTGLFWLVVAWDKGRISPRVEGSGTGFPRAVMATYFVLSLVVVPLVVLLAGPRLEKHYANLTRGAAAFAFARVGLALAILVVFVLNMSEPQGAAIMPTIWLFGVPIVATAVLTYLCLDPVVRSPLLTQIVTAIALLPPVVVALFLLGLYVAQGSGVTA